MSPHCPTCTCPAGESSVCAFTVHRAHETFECQKLVGHEGTHVAMVAWPPCRICDGLDGHSADCPASYETTVRSADLSWDDHGEITVRDPALAALDPTTERGA